MSKQMIIRIDPALKNKVENCARAEGKNVSMIVRELLEGYIIDRDISAGDITEIIKQIRTEEWEELSLI
jgi:predicted DNA-binding protein